MTANAVSVGSITYTVTATDACGNTTTSDVAVVTNPGIANNTITATTALALCAGSNALLTGSTPTGGTGSYTYQWELSQDAAPFAAIVGGTGISHTAAFPVAGTYALRRRVTSGDCTPSYSNTVTFTISATDPIVNNTISTPATQVCDGEDPASFGGTTPPTLAGGDGVTYTYQWEQQVNGGAWTPLGGATAATYDPLALALVGGNNTTYAFRRAVSSGACVNAYSNTLTLTVYVGFAGNTLTAPATTTLCAGGDPANIVGSVPTVGQGALVPITYQWQQNVNGGGWTDIGGATAQAYDPPALSTPGTWEFRRLANAGPCLNHVSNVVTITILDPVSTNTLTAPFQTAWCAPADVTIILGSAPSGGNGAYTYQWQSSTNGAAFVNIGGATLQNYDPASQNPAIPTVVQYRRLVTSGPCSGALASVSDPVTITITPGIANNTLTAPATINYCQQGDPDLLMGSTPTGGDGSYAYQWQLSVNSTTVYEDVIGATARDYDPTTLSLVGAALTTYRFRRIVTSGLCTSISAVVTITIQPGVTNTFTAVNTTFCDSGDPPNIAAPAATNGGGAPYFYRWEQRIDGGAWATAPGTANAQAYDPPLLTNGTATTMVHEFRRVAWSALCPEEIISLQLATYTLLPAISNNSITAPAVTSICGNPDAIVGADPVGGIGTYTSSGNTSARQVRPLLQPGPMYLPPCRPRAIARLQRETSTWAPRP